jgi:hypothetical protein
MAVEFPGLPNLGGLFLPVLDIPLQYKIFPRAAE